MSYTLIIFLTGLSKNSPAKDYSLSSSKSEQSFDAFLSISILASVFGNGILPEIQVFFLTFRNPGVSCLSCLSKPNSVDA
jgi:hypothetical protein